MIDRGRGAAVSKNEGKNFLIMSGSVSWDISNPQPTIHLHGGRARRCTRTKLLSLWILNSLPLRQEPPEGRRRRTFVVVVAVVFYFLKVSKVYVFLKFFNF